MIADGDDDATLRHDVGHIPGTAVPWEAGKCGARGASRHVFPRSGRVRLNDVIVLETLRGTYRYRVERISVVGPLHIKSAGVMSDLKVCPPKAKMAR